MSAAVTPSRTASPTQSGSGSVSITLSMTVTAPMTSPAMTLTMTPSMPSTPSASPPMTPAPTVPVGNSQSRTNVAVGTAFLAVSNSPTGAFVAASAKPTPPAGNRPSVPSQLKVTKKTTNTITIQWTDNNKSTTKWQVSVKIHTAGIWINLNSNSKTFTISNLYPGSNYNIRVAAVSNSGKRGPFTPSDNGLTARTQQSNIAGIFNIQGKWNKNDKQLHIRWQNGKVAFTSISATVSCAGTTVSFTIPAGAKNNYPIRNIPQGQSGCTLTVVPQYSAGAGNSFQSTFNTI